VHQFTAFGKTTKKIRRAVRRHSTTTRRRAASSPTATCCSGARPTAALSSSPELVASAQEALRARRVVGSRRPDRLAPTRSARQTPVHCSQREHCPCLTNTCAGVHTSRSP
jgi:hypothetical protein